MGMEEGGETYYWNEFNLVGSGGASATLVYEATEHDGEWRLFTLFEPQSPLSAREAADKRVGDKVNLGGKLLPITLVDESRVYHIEGQAPEGVELGDVARYFNAEAGNDMVVVSWTGEEVEFYRGLDLPRGAVTTAFGLASEAALFTSETASARSATRRWVGGVVGAVLVVIIAVVSYSSCRTTRRQAAASKPKLAEAPLAIGTAGRLDGANYRIVSHSVVEIAHVGGAYDRHEYQIQDDRGGTALLVAGYKPGMKSWFLFTPLQPTPPRTPSQAAPHPRTPCQAATNRLRDSLDLDGVRPRVTGLFQSRILRTEGPESPEPRKETILYGLDARDGTNLFLVRWNQQIIVYFRGQPVPAKDAISAFPQKR
jgi:hypothetical protein